MKKFNYISTGILAVLIVILYILHFTGKKTTQDKAQVAVQQVDSAFTMPIAYVNLDSVLMNYYFSKDLNEQLVRQTESAQATLNQKAKSLQNDMAEFKRKLDNNAFLSQQSAESQQQRILKAQQDFEQLQQKLGMELQEKQLETNMILRDTIMSQLHLFNSEYNYQVIFSNTMNDNILYSVDQYDITSVFIDFLNKKYVPKTAE